MATDKNKHMPAAAELRRCAEKQLQAQAADADMSRAEDETSRLLHELQVHQL